jgi:carboxymethylenebutenolidase
MKNALPLLPRIAAVFVCATCGITAAAAHSQDWAKAVLNKSPRHQEWVKVTYGSRTVNAFVVYPEVSHKAPVVLLIHEIFGLTDWARSMADDIAAMGYIVIAPDLLSGFGPNGGDTSAFPDMQSTTKAVSGLCWGGGKSFLFATQRKGLSAAFVFYGPPPPTESLAQITAPVYGFYAGNDARITATVPATKDAMAAAGKKYESVIYDGAGHGFMRAGEDPTNTNPANTTARTEGLKRLETLLKGM